MSEYQYYEFRAVDKPLDTRAQAALRRITSRGEITPTSLVNEYHWGDFRGDPDQLDGQVLRCLPLLRQLGHASPDVQGAAAARSM